MSELYGIAGVKGFSELLADPKGANKVALPIEPGQGVLTRGTILYRKANGMWTAAATSQMSTSYALAILDEDVNTDLNLGVAEDAGAYLAGTFVREKVFLKAGDAITAAYELVLRLEGFVLSPMQDANNGFDNAKVIITYKANNGTEEADYLAYEDKGATHTVLANTVTKFTAPSTKSFSKWNTKADGSGTEYAAAASYTANEDLTLYAVWA